MKVTASYRLVSAIGWDDPHRMDIPQPVTGRKVGKGWQYVYDLTDDELDRLTWTVETVLDMSFGSSDDMAQDRRAMRDWLRSQDAKGEVKQ